MTHRAGSTPPLDPAASIAALERKLAARDKTIAVMVARVLASDAAASGALGVTRRHIALERVVARKTRELQDERRRLEDTVMDLRSTQARLVQAQKMESIGQLAAGIAHEINTPTQFVSDNVTFLRSAIDSIMAVLDVALETLARAGSSVTPEMNSHLQRAMEAADLAFLREQLPDAFAQSAEGLHRIATIVKAMKAFSHPSRGTPSEESIADVVHTTLIVARNELKYVADVEELHQPDAPRVPCLRDEISQAVLNIVINAAHAIAGSLGPGRERGRIRVATRVVDGYAEIAVTDDGPGIPESIRARVFDPFFTTKGVGEGTGQGLAMAYSTVVDKHGGRIYFDTEPGVGTTFYIRLPLQGSGWDPAPGDDAADDRGRPAVGDSR